MGAGAGEMLLQFPRMTAYVYVSSNSGIGNYLCA